MDAEGAWWIEVPLPVVLAEARQVYGRVIARRLRAAGHGDLPRHGARLVGGIAANGPLQPDGLVSTGVPEPAVRRTLDELVAHGYLAVTGTGAWDLTDRGGTAAAVVREAVVEVDDRLVALAGADTVAAMRRALGTLVDDAHRRAGGADAAGA